MSNFFSRLSYSFGNEDWRSEKTALKVGPEDRVLSITASGDRPLNLLLDKCKEIISVDANPIQNYLLNLKCIAMQELPYEKYIAFLGVLPCKNRLEILNKLLPLMNQGAQKYWLEHKKMISKGILYQGLLEKRCKNILAPFFQLCRGKKIRQLFEFSNLDEQREFIKSSWDKYFLRKSLHLALNSVTSRLLLSCVVDDPGIYNHLNESVNLGAYFYKRMNDGFMDNLARESLLFSIIFKGHVGVDALPPYLTEEGTKIIKSRINCIAVKNADIVGYLENVPHSSFDCFSLSDVASYLSQKDFTRMMHQVYRVAKPGARFSIRQFFSNHKMTDDLQKLFWRDGALEKKLEKEDRCFVYRFIAGTINKP